MALLAPALAGFAIVVGILVSLSSSDFRVAQQVAVLASAPVIAFVALFTFRVLDPSPELYVAAARVLPPRRGPVAGPVCASSAASVSWSPRPPRRNRVAPRRARGKLDRMGEAAIRLRGVVKRYGPITAVGGLDLDVPVGTCVGLLGPNGAGKSTTMRLLTAQAIADEGVTEVLGFTLQESKQARALLGVTPQLDNLDTTLTVAQNLLVFAHLYRIGRHERHDAIERALQMAKLVDRRDTRVDKLSGGMRRRLLIARALVHRPRLVLLDEPTVGLDPQVRQELWALIDALRSEGTTILMSTHYIEEAQRLADTVLIMSHGKAVASGRRRPSSRSMRARRCSRCTARRRASRRWKPRRARPGCARGGRARASRSSASTARTASPARASGGRRSRGRVRAADRRGDRLMAIATGPAHRVGRPALGSHRRPRPRGRTSRRTGARRRSRRPSGRRSTCCFELRLRIAGGDDRRPRLRRVRRDRDGGDGGALLRARFRPCSGRSSSTSSSERTTRSWPRPSTPRSW